MNTNQSDPKKRRPDSPLSRSEAEFNRWMEQLDLDGLDLERLERQTEALDTEPDDED